MKESELKKGDILLYSCKQKPKFTPREPSQSLKDYIKANFLILIDKLIIWAENSNTTHAALAYDFVTNETTKEIECKVAEATLPYCRLRTPAYGGENFKITVHRLPDGLDGAPVLNELPELVDDDTQNNSYAMAQACVAALLCIFRTKISDNHEKAKKLLIFLKFIGYPLGKWIDTKFPSYKDNKTPFFCSQLAAYCYDMTALHLKDERYRVKTPANGKIGDALIDYLIKNDFTSITEANESDAIEQSDIELYSPEVFYSLCDAIEDDSINSFEGLLEENQLPELYTQLKNDSENLTSLMASAKSLLTKLMKMFGIDLNVNKEELTKELIDFQTSFIMPSDLENVFEIVGEV